MGVIQNMDTTACLFPHRLPHTFGERTGGTNGSAFADTESKRNGVCALFYQKTVSQHRFFLNYLGPAIQIWPAHCLL